MNVRREAGRRPPVFAYSAAPAAGLRRAGPWRRIRPVECAFPPSSPENAPMSDWSLDQARKTYSIPHWSEGYFDIDGAGRIAVKPRGERGPTVALPEVVDAARANGA